jgi:hypothetical protein
MSTTTTFDTLMYAKRLKEAGFTETQAEVQAEAMKEIIDNQLATKQDILDLRREIKESENRIIIRLGSLITGCFAALGILVTILSKVH